MRCDDGFAINLLGMAHYLIDFGQGIGYGQLIAVAPDDATSKVPAPAHQSYLSQGFYTFIGEEQTIEVFGIGLTNHIEIAFEPWLIDAGMSEEILLGTDRLLVGEFELMAISEEVMEGFGVTSIVTFALAELAIVRRVVMQIMIAQQEHHLIWMTIVEVDNINETMHGSVLTYLLTGIGIDIIAQEYNLGVVARSNCLAPEPAAMNIGYNQYLIFHAFAL